MAKLQPCKHLAQPDKLHIEYVLDVQTYPTEGFVRCTACDAWYWFELDHLAGAEYRCRLSIVPAAAVRKTVDSLNKGSCDINRAQNGVFSLRQLSEPLDATLCMRGGAIVAVEKRDQARS